MIKISGTMSLTVDYDRAIFTGPNGYTQVILKPTSVGIAEWENFWCDPLYLPEEKFISASTNKQLHEKALAAHDKKFNKKKKKAKA